MIQVLCSALYMNYLFLPPIAATDNSSLQMRRPWLNHLFILLGLKEVGICLNLKPLFSATCRNHTKDMVVSWKGSRYIEFYTWESQWLLNAESEILNIQRSLDETHSSWQWLTFYPSILHLPASGCFPLWHYPWLSMLD